MLPESFPEHSFCIYGAGIVAASIYTAIKTLYHKKPSFFLISDFGERGGMLSESTDCGNPSAEIDGIPIKTLSEWKMQLEDIPDLYLIAVPEIHHPAIIESLRSLDFLSIEESQIILFTNELENELMEMYYRSLPNCTTVHSLLTAKTEQDDDGQTGSGVLPIQVFQAKSHADKPLHSPPEEWKNNLRGEPFRGYVYPIQAGAALADRIIADLQDNTGENISAKNRNYCELTAAYYAWKNSHAAYKGICHYRRIFDIDAKQMQALLSIEHEWDVILPYPSVYYPSIASEHTRYVSEADWSAMLRALKEIAPEYLETYEELVSMGEHRFYNFNMLIAKAAVFDEYCNFLFQVLDKTEEYIIPKESERADRFAGYLGENLTTLYFLKNRDRLKIAYAGKILYT